MTTRTRLLGCVVIVVTVISAVACNEGGIGMSVPTSGARWGSGTAGPDVFVGGGPVYR